MLALAAVPGVGTRRLRSLLAAFGSAEAVLHASSRALSEVPDIGPQTAKAIRRCDAVDAADAQLLRAEQLGARLVTLWDDVYPERLRHIFDPPPFLWVRGTIKTIDASSLAVVGTRRATDYGKRIAAEWAAELAGRGVTVVSGLAYGIDAAAHRGAIEGGGRTLAVLGSGVDRIYPARHMRLAAAISEAGALLSEYPLGTAPDASNFPRRNRVISGLTLGTLVVEAYEKGGALITARLALEQDRDVFAVPSPLHNPAGRGANGLIREGLARLVTSVDDIIGELGLVEGPAQGIREAPPPDLGPIEQRLYDAIGAEPVQIDVLCQRTDLDPSTALVYLLGLEFKGLVRQMAGKQFYRTG